MFVSLMVFADGSSTAETTHGSLEAEMKELFAPYRGLFSRNTVSCSDLLQIAKIPPPLIRSIDHHRLEKEDGIDW